MRTITAIFDSRADAESARARLASAGISEDDITIHDKTPGNSVDNRTDRPVGADSNLLGGFVEGNGNRRGEGMVDHDRYRAAEVGDDRSLWDRIKDFFSGDDDVYAEGHGINRAVAILDGHGVAELDEPQAGWREDGGSGGTRRQQNDRDRKLPTYDRSHWLA